MRRADFSSHADATVLPSGHRRAASHTPKRSWRDRGPSSRRTRLLLLVAALVGAWVAGRLTPAAGTAVGCLAVMYAASWMKRAGVAILAGLATVVAGPLNDPAALRDTTVSMATGWLVALALLVAVGDLAVRLHRQ